MSDSTISAMPPAVLPLSTELAPCVQSNLNKQIPAAALGIPVQAASAPTARAQFQTWIDTTLSPPTLKMYIGSSWVALYKIAAGGGLTLSQPLTLSADPVSAAQVATKHYVDNASHAGALAYRGVKDCSANPDYPAADQGHLYYVSVAGIIGGASGIGVGMGDMLLCRVDHTGAGNQVSVGANWTIIQGHNTAVTGPASAADGDFAQHNGSTGKLIKDTGLSFDTDPTMAANSDLRVPSQKAVRSSIGGIPLSPDVLAQGQGWIWDGTGSNFRGRTNEGENLLVNSAFDIWQEYTNYTIGSSAPKLHVADFWKVGLSGAAQKTLSRIAGLSDAQYAIKVQRNPGSADNGRFRLAQQFSTADSMYLAGKSVTVSFDFVIGANFSPPSSPYATLLLGTGLEEDVDLHAGFPAFATGGSMSQALLQTQVAPAGIVARLISPPLAIPSGTTEVLLAISMGAYAGTAGPDDTFAIGNVKMEIGNVATPYRKPDASGELKRCQRRYWKTFLQSAAPAQAAGSGTSEHRGAATKAGASAQTLGTLRIPTMRAVPSVTLFNPVSASAQARDLTAGADCTSTVAQNISDSGFEVVATGNASTAVGNTLGVHAIADARL